MKVDEVRQQLQNLVAEVNSVHIEFDQQNVTKANMSIIGGNGRLFVQPCSIGYDISLSGKSLEDEMYSFMCNLCGKECDGYKQTNGKIGKKDQPFWRVDDFDLVREAVYRYSRTNK